MHPVPQNGDRTEAVNVTQRSEKVFSHVNNGRHINGQISAAGITGRTSNVALLYVSIAVPQTVVGSVKLSPSHHDTPLNFAEDRRVGSGRGGDRYFTVRSR